MAAQWPLIREHLATLLPTLPGWAAVQVINGPPIEGDFEPIYITVGYAGDTNAGRYTTVQEPDGFRWRETGSVRSEMTSYTGDDDLIDTETGVFAAASAFEQYVRNDRTLGGFLSPDSTCDLEVEILTERSGVSTKTSLILTLSYATAT